MTEDKDYVVYIDVAAETNNAVAETTDMADEANVESDENGENTISQNTVSENEITSEESATENSEDETSEDIESVDVTASVDMIGTAANVQESIEKAEEILSENGAEVVKDEETIIYKADLTQREIQELESSDATIIVEENIELFGAGKQGKSQQKSNKLKEKSTTKEEKEEKKEKTEKTEKRYGFPHHNRCLCP